jgi:hypothetical protein
VGIEGRGQLLPACLLDIAITTAHHSASAQCEKIDQSYPRHALSSNPPPPSFL